jgi:hypothetical protein
MRPTVIGGGAVKRHMETAMCASICSYIINIMDQFPLTVCVCELPPLHNMGNKLNDHSN